nr:unnamed protein product [Callosobruchus analis]
MFCYKHRCLLGEQPSFSNIFNQKTKRQFPTLVFNAVRSIICFRLEIEIRNTYFNLSYNMFVGAKRTGHDGILSRLAPQYALSVFSFLNFFFFSVKIIHNYKRKTYRAERNENEMREAVNAILLKK